METFPPTIWAHHRLEWGRRTHIMGIINVTPDSFSGDGLVTGAEDQDVLTRQAVARARHAVEEGATLIDVGGESTRPGFAPLPAEQEL
ncbi:MAG: dihydropteroate synthase, partial [Ktedonobacteraceae bacterium]|nr:dihydropteroate synthase [Ktedonobacteraceae bacterium]